MIEESKPEKNGSATRTATALGILSIALAVITILMAVNIIPTMNSNKAAKLVNVGIGGYDQPRQHTLRVTGWICNTGLEPSYHTQLHVQGVYTTGGEAIDTYVDIGNGGVVYGQDSAKVDVNVGYSADGLGSWTVTPVWTYVP
ncbi:MAG: hypothetical protein ACE14S_06790 [Candidatus Bathyarchaeia archaeon]